MKYGPTNSYPTDSFPTANHKWYYVYFMTNQGHTTLYIGVTNDLTRRVSEHREQKNPNSFTARYNLNRLVHFEPFKDIRDAITREKELKGWKRERKDSLVEKTNPNWSELAQEILGLSPIENLPFRP